MGAAESRGGRNEDKRTSRRENRAAFSTAISAWRSAHGHEVPGGGGGAEGGAEGDSGGLALPPPVHAPPGAASGLHVCLRKRPVFQHELTRGDFDAITCAGSSTVVVHNARCATKQPSLLAQLHLVPF
jgi:hypothetical protein